MTSASRGPATRLPTSTSGYDDAASIMAGTEKSRLRAIPCRRIVGEVGAGQQAPTQRERLGMLADPGRAHRLLIDRAPGVDVCVDKQDVVFGKRDLGGALGEQVAELVVASRRGSERRSDTAARRGSVETPKPSGRRPEYPATAPRDAPSPARAGTSRVEDLLAGPATHLEPAAHTTCARWRNRPDRSSSGLGRMTDRRSSGLRSTSASNRSASRAYFCGYWLREPSRRYSMWYSPSRRTAT